MPHIKEITLILSMIGGAWIFFRYLSQREFYPRMEFNTNINFKNETDDLFIVEIYCSIRNVGSVRHKPKKLYFSVKGIKPTDEYEDGDDKILNQLNFPHPVKNGLWFPENWKYSYIEPGTTQEYRHLAKISKEYSALMIHGKMHYRLRGYRTANRLVAMPKSLTEASSQQH